MIELENNLKNCQEIAYHWTGYRCSHNRSAKRNRRGRWILRFNSVTSVDL